MKQLPRNVLQNRKKYRKLTDKLKQLNIRYRWEIPQGVSFNYQSTRQIIKNTEQIVMFMFDHSKDFEEDK